MKMLTWMLSLGLVVATQSEVTFAAAAKSEPKAASSRKASPSGALQTDVKFGDGVLHGQYQVPEEALAKVENEKGLSDLIGVRKHFKDRLSTASEQE